MVLSVGNTRLAVGVFLAGNLEFVTRVPHADRAQWKETLAEAWSRMVEQPGASVAGASVNPGVMEPLEHLVEQVTAQKVQWVGRELDLPIKVLTDTPAETGVDRVLNVAAAYEQMGKACVVVDAGTAVTVDCCNDDGDFVGGAIGPGVEMMLEALHEKTARLPRVSFEVPQGAYGKNTESAIRFGVFAAARGMVKELTELYATELGTWPDLIATGGDAKKLFEGWELVHAIAPDLTLYGIALAYAEHHIKHGT